MTGTNNALLASAAYINFFDINGNSINKKDIENNLKKTDGDGRRLTQAQAQQFLDNYEVLHQQLETSSGFSAMVVREKIQ